MYTFQLVAAFYEDFFMQVKPMDSDQLIYLAPFFIIILSIVYLVRVKVFDKIFGIDLSELEETKILNGFLQTPVPVFWNVEKR